MGGKINSASTPQINNSVPGYSNTYWPSNSQYNVIDTTDIELFDVGKGYASMPGETEEYLEIMKVKSYNPLEIVYTSMYINKNNIDKTISDLEATKKPIQDEISELMQKRNNAADQIYVGNNADKVKYYDNEIDLKQKKIDNIDSEIAKLKAQLYPLNKQLELRPYEAARYSEGYQSFVNNYNNYQPVDYKLFNECNNNIGEYLDKIKRGKSHDELERMYENGDFEINKIAIIEYLLTSKPEGVTEENFFANLDMELRDAYTNYKYMTEEQRMMYHFLFATQGEKYANQYLSIIQDSINQVAGADRANAFIQSLDLNDKGQVEDSLCNLFNVSGKGLGDGITTFFEGLENVIENNDTLTAEEYERMIILQYLQENSNCLDGVYTFSSSLGNMIPAMVASAAVSYLATPAAGAATASWMMGFSAGGNAKHSALVKGNSLLTSTVYGTFIGASEGTLGYYLGKIPGISKTSGLIFKDLISEGAEEYIQTYVEAGCQAAILGEDVNWDEIPSEAANSFAMGFLMSGFLNGGQSVISLSINGEIRNIDIEATLNYMKENPNCNVIDAISYVNPELSSVLNGDTIKYKSKSKKYQTHDIRYDNGQITTISDMGITKINGKDVYMYNISIHDGNGGKVFYSESNLTEAIEFGDRKTLSFIRNDFLSQERIKEISNNNNGYLGYFTLDNTTGQISKHQDNDLNMFIQNSINTRLDIFFNKYRDLSGYNYGVDQNITANLKHGTGIFSKKHEFVRIKNKLINQYGFSARDATIILTQMDSTGACSYADVANEIFIQFMDDPNLFYQTFGYNMYTTLDDGSVVLNSAELLADLYIFANHADNGGNLFASNNGKNKIIDFKNFTHSNMNTKNQIYLSHSGGKNNSLIDSFLKSKNSKLLYSCYVMKNRTALINDSSITPLNDVEIQSLKSGLIYNLQNGFTISLGIYKTKYPNSNPIIMYNQDGGPNMSTTTWNEGGGHAIFVTGVTDDGVIVSSWGRKFSITFEDLKTNPFIFTTSSIIYDD